MSAHRIAAWIARTGWLTACLAVLVFSFLKRDIHDMPVAAFWFMALLAFPSGLFIVALAGYATSESSRLLGIPYQPFTSFLPMWCAGVAVGYWQWFIAVPWFVRKVRSLIQPNATHLQRSNSANVE